MNAVIEGSGNVFADLGLPNAAELQLQASLVYEIHAIVKELGWRASQTATALDWPLPVASALLKGKFIDLPVGQLLEALVRLNRRVEISIKPVGTGASIHFPKAAAALLKPTGNAAAAKK